MIFYGKKGPRIGEIQISNSKCNYCENTGTQHLTVFGKYAHLYWIPLFPIGKEVVAECSHCKRTIPKDEFSDSLNEKYRQAKGEVSRPIWHYTGLAFIVFVLSIVAFSEVTREIDPRHDLLLADIENMSSNPTDSMSMKLKTLLQLVSNEGTESSEFEYLSKQREGKVLMLAKFPNYNDVEKDDKKAILGLMKSLVQGRDSNKELQYYLGIYTDNKFVATKSSVDSSFSSTFYPEDLYDFYPLSAQDEG